ncbi:hypothetical protein Pst134EA_000094 [Puccinia striiformis f. sp. tritici]|uniref:hypothetical protein n=1 Tax=Puccinia striiformis f. sp. tritici TaxID=168172 RepID=UPI0020072228|nr:hypothetical protein Pst134EA_000094 [Puccinia striiformis f. sp. tritici]KAH9473012.1 hypothetical protein Pst134EA_000094 [Puccinia striiformis f. sp. tritici]
MAGDPRSAESAKVKLSTIAAKLITGVNQVPAEVARSRWNSNPLQQQQQHSRPFSEQPSRSVTASVFSAAREERLAHKNNQIYHQRSQTHFDIITPPNPPFFNQSPATNSPARSHKSSAPAMMDNRGEEEEDDEIEDIELLQLIANCKTTSTKTKENEPPRPIHHPRHGGKTQPSSPLPSPSKPSSSARPSLLKNFIEASQSTTTKPPIISNPIRDLYLAQPGDQNGKIESEKQRVDREFEKLLDTMQITEAVRIKMRGLDHPVKSSMLKSSTTPNLISLMKKSSNGQQDTGTMTIGHETIEDSSKQEGSAWWAMYLKSHNFRELRASDLKKLRVALRTKPPAWSNEFIGFGGYNALLKRLKELLEIEWREEQHDDQVLYEILRCFKALLLTEPGRKALSSKLPAPFIQLTSLLYSEKKPGDLSTRQVLVEIILGSFDLDAYLKLKPIQSSAIDWTCPIQIESIPGGLIIPNQQDLIIQNNDGSLINCSHQLLKTLIIGPPDLKNANIVDFVAITHRVRPFKTFVNEFIGVLMDYFWVFCHAENQFWDLKKIDQDSIEAPKVPSGMTGGVEYEAMSYCTCLMKLLNRVITSAPDSNLSKQIYQDLFESGFERCIITLRKSSVDYYPMVHLELSRFISIGLDNRFEFPYNILKYLAGYQGHPL